MSYSRIKVWIAAEILTASDLNSEHDGHITNENDLDTRLTTEVAARTTLEGEHDTLQTNLWNGSANQVANNRVGKASMKDSAVGTSELEALAVTDGKVAAANKDGTADTYSLRRLGNTSLKATAGDDSRLSDERAPTDSSVTYAKMASVAVGDVLICSADIAQEDITNADWVKKKEIRVYHKGAYRIKFDLKGSSSDRIGYGFVRKNGSEIGTQQTTAGSDYETKSQDIAGFVKNDLIQVYVHRQGAGNTVGIKNFRIYIDYARSGVATLN